MIQDPVRHSRVRSTLFIVILAAIPCYLLGLIILWIGDSALKVTPTPTEFVIAATSDTPVYLSPTLPVPTAQFPTKTKSNTPTNTVSPTITSTYFIPSNTPSITPTPTDTLTPTPEPTLTPTNTPVPPDTPVP